MSSETECRRTLFFNVPDSTIPCLAVLASRKKSSSAPSDESIGACLALPTPPQEIPFTIGSIFACHPDFKTTDVETLDEVEQLMELRLENLAAYGLPLQMTTSSGMYSPI